MGHPLRFHIEKSALVRAERERVSELLMRPVTWPSWQPEILLTTGPDRVQVGSVVNGRASMMGFEVDGKNETLEVEEGTVTHEVVVGVGMRVTYEVSEEAGGVRITHRLMSDLPRGPAGRLLSFFLRARLRKMQRNVLENLVAQLEAPSE